MQRNPIAPPSSQRKAGFVALTEEELSNQNAEKHRPERDHSPDINSL
jgi:hypothetical protein